MSPGICEGFSVVPYFFTTLTFSGILLDVPQFRLAWSFLLVRPELWIF